MGMTVALLAALTLAPGDAGELKLTNVRSTHCVLGPVRATEQVLPGDSYCLSFDIEGITIDDTGKARYSVALEVAGSDGKTLFKQEPSDQTVQVALGGDRLPAYAKIDVGLDQKPGDYTLKVMVKDGTSGKSAMLSRSATVLPKDFGMVRLTTSSDPEGRAPVSVPGSGEWLWLQFGVVGFARSGDGKQPDVAVEMRILDENGKPTTAKPMSVEVNKDVPETELAVPMRLLLSLNRPGKFTVELTATCKICNKSAKLSFPLTVAAPR
jgi:hypothetical protein